MAFPLAKISSNWPRSAGHHLCLDEEVPVYQKIPHSLNPGGCHRGDLLEPCIRRHKIVGGVGVIVIISNKQVYT